MGLRDEWAVIAKDGGRAAYQRLESFRYSDGVRLAVNFTIDLFPPPGEGSGLHNPRALRENWRAELAAVRRLGRCFTMTVHPGLIGWGEGLGLLEETLAAMREGDPVWTPTGRACARWWATRYPAATTLRLAPSIWQDHPGSLS